MIMIQVVPIHWNIPKGSFNQKTVVRTAASGGTESCEKDPLVNRKKQPINASETVNKSFRVRTDCLLNIK